MKFFYDIALHLIAFCFLLRSPKYWKRLKKRLGKGFPKVEKGNRPLIWVHAVSLGETKAIAPLVKQLKRLKSRPLILLSTVTETGFAEGKRSCPEVDYHVFLPWDLSYIIRRIVRRAAPDLVILTETDFWWNFQDEAKKQGALLYLVNGKISKRSFERLLRFPKLADAFLGSFDLLCVQGEMYANRFMKLGVLEEKIVKTGNIKLDGFTPEKDAPLWKKRLGIREGDLVLTLGSTHDAEEKVLMRALNVLWERFPNLKVLLVPRHPERFDIVEDLLTKEKVSFSRLSKKTEESAERVVLVDMMGNLRKCYQISDVAFVGGSLTSKVGGHNILEPAFYGVPVLFGPHMFGQPDFLDLVNAYEAGAQVEEEKLVDVLDRFLKDAALRQKIGQNGLKLVREGQGALQETILACAACENIQGRDKIFPLSRDGAVVSSLGS